MIVDTLIESFSAYKAVRDADPKGERIWWTTSPYLLMHLPVRGEDVRSPEQDLPNEQYDCLGRLAYDFSWKLCNRLNDLCSWRDFADLRTVLAQALQRAYLTVLYKGLLLSRVHDLSAGNLLVVVGDPSVQPAALSPQFGRFETVFALLAKRMSLPLINHVMDFGKLSRLEASVTGRSMERTEKILSILNNTPGSFLSKLWAGLFQKRVFPRTLGWLPWGRRFWVFKKNELLEESLLPLFLRGARLSLLSAFRPPACPISAQPLPEEEPVSQAFREVLKTESMRMGIQNFSALDTCAGIMLERTLGSLRALRLALPTFDSYFGDLARDVVPGDMVLTNLLSGPQEFSFYCWLRRRGIEVASFEHGLTLGLSRFMDWEARYASVRAGTLGLYHTRAAMRAARPYAPDQEQVLAGLPRVTRRVSLRPLTRALSRRLLHIRRNEHVVMLVADLDRNNSVHGPYAETDLQFLAKTRASVENAARAFPSSRVVVKLYPTRRYVDLYDFEDLAGRLPNVLLARDMDFRFIRAAADLILVSNAQSTLGWVLGAGVPSLFLEYPWAPTHLTGLRLGEPVTPEKGRAFFLDRSRLVEPPESGWIWKILIHRSMQRCAG